MQRNYHIECLRYKNVKSPKIYKPRRFYEFLLKDDEDQMKMIANFYFTIQALLKTHNLVY